MAMLWQLLVCLSENVWRSSRTRGLRNVPSRSICWALVQRSPPALPSLVCGSQRMEMGIKYSLLAPSNRLIAENIWLSLGTAQHHAFFSLFSGLFPPSCLLACGTRIYVRKARCVNCFPFRAACLYWDAFVTLDSWETPCPFLAPFSISVSSSSLTLFSLYFPSPLFFFFFFFFTSPSFLYPPSSFFSSLTWFRVRRAHAKRIAMYKS